MEYYRERLAADNIRLVYYLFNKLYKTDITTRYSDDLISEGMIGLVKAANSFDERRNIKFATYASMCIHNQMLMFIRKLKKFIGVEVSLYQPVNIDNEGNEFSYVDLIESKEVTEDMLIAVADFKAFLQKQKRRDGKIYLSYCKGYSQKEIAKKYRISQSYISRIIGNIRKGYAKLSG